MLVLVHQRRSRRRGGLELGLIVQCVIGIRFREFGVRVKSGSRVVKRIVIDILEYCSIVSVFRNDKACSGQ